MTQPPDEPKAAPMPPVERPVGLLAVFDGPDALVEAARAVRAAGYRRWDCYSPYPVHGLERAMGTRPTLLPWLVLGGGVTGAAGALLMQWWMNAVDYPFVISGKPLFSLPAFIPVMFELVILLAAFATVLGLMGLSRLPEFCHPLLRVPRFRRVTTDGFFLAVDTRDPQYDEAAARTLFQSAGALAVEVVCDTDAGRTFPYVLPAVAVVLAVLALIPPLLVARARGIPSDKPPIHLVPDMDFQPKFRAQSVNTFFPDRRAARPQVPGTVAAGAAMDDPAFAEGGATVSAQIEGKPQELFRPVEAIAVEPTRENMLRGRERFDVYCAPCHGLVGDGNGMVTLRAARRTDSLGWVPPASLVGDAVRGQPAGQILHTIAKGVRTMPGYAAQIPADDRWRIVLYVRALQRSQNAVPDDVPGERRGALGLQP